MSSKHTDSIPRHPRHRCFERYNTQSHPPSAVVSRLCSQVAQLIDLWTEGLSAMTETRHLKIWNAFRRAKDKFPQSITLPTVASLVDQVDQVSMKFAADVHDAELKLGKPIPFAHPQVIDRVNKEHALYKSLDDDLAGGAAVQRAISILGFQMMKCPLRKFTVAEIMNLAGMVRVTISF